jgi:hypothetical protein
MNAWVVICPASACATHDDVTPPANAGDAWQRKYHLQP